MTKNRIDSVINKLSKKYGKEVIGKGFSLVKKWFPTGITNLDWALGGGFIQGGFIELYGPPSSGKSTLALKAMALAQKEGKTCAYIDVEDAYDPGWATTNGVDNDNLLVLNKEQVNEIAKKKNKGIDAEFILQLMIDLIKTEDIDILVLDSIACLTPKDELNKEMEEEARIAGVAKLLNRALRVLNTLNQRKATILFINQIRDNVGSYGGGTTTPGGKALKFYALQRVNVKRGKNLVKKDTVIGYNAKVKVEKNKVGIEQRAIEYVFYNDATVDRFETYWNLAQNLNDFGEGVDLQGRTYSFKGKIVAKSQDEFKTWLKDHNDIFENLEKSLISGVIKDIEKAEGEKVEIEEVDVKKELSEEKEEIKKGVVGDFVLEEKSKEKELKKKIEKN